MALSCYIYGSSFANVSVIVEVKMKIPHFHTGAMRRAMYKIFGLESSAYFLKGADVFVFILTWFGKYLCYILLPKLSNFL